MVIPTSKVLSPINHTRIKMADLDVEYETHDIYLAAYLMICGCTLLRQRRQGPRKYFIFTNPGGSVKEMREAYYAGTGMVKAHQYAQTVIAVKQLCFDG